MQASSEYLTLALDVRKVTDSLIRLVEDGTLSPQLNASIQQVLTSLQGNNLTSVRSLRERGPFGRYVSVRAIKEVFSEDERKRFVGTLQMVVRPQAPKERTENALAAIPFFDALERRALYHHGRAQASKRYTQTR